MAVVGALAAIAVGSMGTVNASAHGTPTKIQDLSLRALAARHGLAIGTAVDTTALVNADDPKYRQITAAQFSTVTPENVMKWESLEPTQGTYNWAPADSLIKFAEQNHQQVRGHVLVWHSQLPSWLTTGVANGSISNDQLRALLKKHITDTVTHFKGKIWQWDVVNEAVSDPWNGGDIHLGGAAGDAKGFWVDHLGPNYIADAFRWARAADPKALLFYNDYNIEAFGSLGGDDKTQFVYNLVKGLKAQGVPIDGVGSQGHLSTQYGNYDVLQVSDALRKFSDLGLATALTEVDARSLTKRADDSTQPALDADLNARDQASAYNYHVLLQACLSNPHCLSFTVWGFSENHSWIPGVFTTEGNGTIYDANYQPHKSFRTLQGDLAFAGPPLVQPRIPQKPRR